MKKGFVWLLLAAMLLPGGAMGTQEKMSAWEVLAPGFSYHTIGTEAGGLIALEGDQTKVASGLFILEDGYLSIAYAQEDDVLIPYPAGKPLICMNRDLSVRWVLEDERLTGAWYTNLLELPDAMLLGWERSPGEAGQVYSLLMIEKDTGVIRWQLEGPPIKDGSMVWIGECRADENGNIMVGSSGGLQGSEGGTGTLSLLNAIDGSLLWAVEYQEDYGALSIWDICPLGEGWLLYGMREEDRIILYVDSKGVAQSYFTFEPWAESYDYTSLRLIPVSGDVVYLGGWELEGRVGYVETPFRNRTMQLMRITEETFGDENVR